MIIDSYNDYNSDAPWNREELPKEELTELEQLQEDYWDLLIKYKKVLKKLENYENTI